MWARAASDTAHGVSVCSSVQFLKLLRNPRTVVRSARPTERRIFVSDMLDKGSPFFSGEEDADLSLKSELFAICCHNRYNSLTR